MIETTIEKLAVQIHEQTVLISRILESRGILKPVDTVTISKEQLEKLRKIPTKTTDQPQ